MNEVITSVVFYFTAFIVIACAIGVVFVPKLVHSAALLFASFLGIAVVYVLLNADFVAMTQVLVYSVGIVVIIIFGIMLTNPQSEQTFNLKQPRVLFSAFVSFALLLILLISIFSNSFIQQKMSVITFNRVITEGTTGMIGENLLTKYLLPFEIISVLLLAAIIGAVILSRRTNVDVGED